MADPWLSRDFQCYNDIHGISDRVFRLADYPRISNPWLDSHGSTTPCQRFHECQCNTENPWTAMDQPHPVRDSMNVIVTLKNPWTVMDQPHPVRDPMNVSVTDNSWTCRDCQFEPTMSEIRSVSHGTLVH